MIRVSSFLKKSRKQSGQAMIEYGLLVGLVSVSAIAAAQVLQPQVLTLFQNVVNAL